MDEKLFKHLCAVVSQWLWQTLLYLVFYLTTRWLQNLFSMTSAEKLYNTSSACYLLSCSPPRCSVMGWRCQDHKRCFNEKSLGWSTLRNCVNMKWNISSALFLTPLNNPLQSALQTCSFSHNIQTNSPATIHTAIAINLLDNNVLLYVVLKQSNVCLCWEIKLAKHKIYILLLKKKSKNKHVNNMNELAIRHTIQLHRYIFSIPHIQSAKKSNDYKANKDAAIYIERCMYNDYSIHNCTMPQ